MQNAYDVGPFATGKASFLAGSLNLVRLSGNVTRSSKSWSVRICKIFPILRRLPLTAASHKFGFRQISNAAGSNFSGFSFWGPTMVYKGAGRNPLSPPPLRREQQPDVHKLQFLSAPPPHVSHTPKKWASGEGGKGVIARPAAVSANEVNSVLLLLLTSRRACIPHFRRRPPLCSPPREGLDRLSSAPVSTSVTANGGGGGEKKRGEGPPAEHWGSIQIRILVSIASRLFEVKTCTEKYI